ncbi:hypothetical protein KBD81_02685 [Candidatus Woesebacteria bacterium]|nr:hypothetical protein [Candidatus Woesebacteria bacterium]
MKRYLSLVGLVFLPAIFLFDLVIFFGGGTQVTCLQCDVSQYIRTSSMSFHVLSSSWIVVRDLVYKRG